MSAIKFVRFDPAGCAFPKPVVGLLPDSASGRLGTACDATWATVLDNQQVIHYSRGRYALREAYRRATEGHGLVFLPAYHCRTMVDPAVDLGLKVIFFPITESLSPDLPGLAECFRSAGLGDSVNSAVLVVPHYFGFRQPLAALRALCARHGVQIIEDCSHALINSPSQPGLGAEGDFMIASPYKFFGSEDGGALVQLNPLDRASNPLHGADWFHAGKAWVRLALQRFQPVKKNAVRKEIEALSVKVAQLRKSPGAKGVDILQSASLPSAQYDAAEAQNAALRASRWLIAHVDIADLANARRENYKIWLKCVESLPGCRALYPTLPADSVPYMFPLILDNPEMHFYLLKRLGVPVGRWDEIAVSDCSVAKCYRLNLIHLPCYQGLNFTAMSWLTGAVTAVLLSGEKKSA
ncbi:MAG: hypothetical protein CVU16_10065 [Betaproteobacteria bacterium HGW-Betaproteobacteria-10]|nr:MAG: hypothetical protein CVU16_10065 [Betaproteobacteria bacterium HGW-Betaproteobacteria-10]